MCEPPIPYCLQAVKSDPNLYNPWHNTGEMSQRSRHQLLQIQGTLVEMQELASSPKPAPTAGKVASLGGGGGGGGSLKRRFRPLAAAAAPAPLTEAPKYSEAEVAKLLAEARSTTRVSSTNPISLVPPHPFLAMSKEKETADLRAQCARAPVSPALHPYPYP